MNFHELTYKEVDDFLQLNGINDHNIKTVYAYTYTYPDPYQLAEQLFHRLEQGNAQTFTEPVIDLWIANRVKPIFALHPETRYDKNIIQTVSIEKLDQFANLFNLPLNENLRPRILRILNYLHILTPITMGQLLSMFLAARFYYKIEVDPNTLIDPEITEDGLWRHVIDGLDDFDTKHIKVKKENDTWYLILGLDFKDDILDDDYNNFIDTNITADNFRRLFHIDGDRITVALRFEDDIVVTDANDNDNYEFVNATFTLSHIVSDDNRMFDYVFQPENVVIKS
jgi:hypothetical protein